MPSAEKPAPAAPAAPPQTWAPLRHPTFRMLWLTWLASNACMWMNDVTAAWLMTTLTTSPVLIALVQSAATLPVFLLGLPSGALADILNRRRLFMFTQFWVAANAIVAMAAIFAGVMNAPLLLALTFGNGIGLALRWPVYAAIVPELVPRRELPSAIALNGIAMNTSRVIGPVLAGLLIAGFGSAYVFLLNAVLSLTAGIMIMRWRSEQKHSVLPGERFFGAIRIGFQYVAQSRMMRAMMARVALFFLQSTALLALLPLVARRMPGGDAWTYTVLLASMGLGAVAAAFFLPRLRVMVSRDRLLRDGSVLQAAAMVAAGFAPNLWSAAPAMFIAGVAWITVVNTLTVYTQLALPDWVRARGMAMYMMVMMGSASASAALWGQVASLIEVPWTFVAAALVGLAALWLKRKPAVLARGGGGPDAGAHPEGADAGLRHRAQQVASDGHRAVPDRSGPHGGVSRRDAGKPCQPAAEGRAVLGPVPGHRAARPLRRVLPRRVLGRSPAPLRALHRRRRRTARTAAPLSTSATSRRKSRATSPRRSSAERR
jgi:MFS family permease